MNGFVGRTTRSDASSTVVSKVAAPTGRREYPDDAYFDPMTGIQVGGRAPV
jgi:hypothetical protein